MHVALFIAALFASSVTAQRQTLDDGNMVIVQVTTDVDGDFTTRTLQTLPGAGGVLTGTATGTGTSTGTRTGTSTGTGTGTGTRPTSTTNTRVPTTLDDGELTSPTMTTTTTRRPGANGGNGAPQGVQGPPTTTYPPMSITTYYVDDTPYVWSNSFKAPDAVTVDVPAGTIQEGAAYLSSIGAKQSEQVASAMATYGAKSGAMSFVSDSGIASWVAMFAGMVTAGVGLYVM